MDEQPSRWRYQARRRQVEARRRRVTLLFGAATALLLAAMLYLLRPPLFGTPSAQPTALPLQSQPSASARALQPTRRPHEQVAKPAAASIATATAQPQLSQLIDARRFSYEPNFYVPEVEALLAARQSPLAQVQFQVGGRVHSFAEVLISQTSLYSINPKVVLAILELQSGAVSGANPAELQWAAGYRREAGRLAGLNAQLIWLIRELHRAQRDYPGSGELTYADDSTGPLPQGLTMPEYALARAFAPTVTPGGLGALLGDGDGSFLAVYSRLFEDPRPAQADLPLPAAPFLLRPMEKPFPIASFFDHDAPFLAQNGALTTYWNLSDPDVAYDGHDGWDYAMKWPDKILAAAPGTVVFAGNSDDGCASPARAVIIDHGNGYRTLYWHLSEINVERDQQVIAGDLLGLAGASGCAQGEHLHFQVQYLGRDSDPYGWCGEAADPWATHPAGNGSTWLWADRPTPCGELLAGTVAVDEGSPGFATTGEGWQRATPGSGGSTLYASSRLGASDSQPWELRDPATPPLAVWRPQLPAEGRYRVLAYIPFTAAVDGLPSYAPFRWSSIASSLKVRYIVGHAQGQSEVVVDQALLSNDWADLGTYQFDSSSQPYVALSSLASKTDFGVWADVVVWQPVK